MLVTTEGHHGYRFGDFLLDLDRRALLRNGEEIPLRPKALDVLEILLARAGTLVTRQQLLDTVWPDTEVTDDSISQCLYDIRRALRDEWREQVRTVPRRGVMFDGPVTPVPEHRPRGGVAGRSRSSPISLATIGWAALTLSVAVLLAAGPWWPGLEAPPPESSTAFNPPPHSVAVLAFDDLSPEADSDWFARGVSEEVLNLLAQNPDLTVIARTSSFALSDSNATVPEIARRLDVAHVLEGSVRREGERVRVTAQLVDAHTDAHLWSQTYDGRIGDVFGVQEDIARSVADVLHVELLGGPPPALTHHPEPEAWSLYLRANFLYDRRGSGDVEQALDHYRQATTIDPGFAGAWAGVAGALSLLVYRESVSFDSSVAELTRAAERALELAPNDVVVLLRAARVRRMQGLVNEGWELVHRAQRLDPDHPLVLGATIWWHMVHDYDYERILELQAQAARLDPVNAAVQQNYAYTLLRAGRFDQAEGRFRYVQELTPDLKEVSYHLAVTRLLQGHASEALAAAERLEPPLGWKLAAMANHALGNAETSERALDALQRLPGVGAAVHVAEVHAYRHEPAAATEWLDIARERLEGEPPHAIDTLLIASQGALLRLHRDDPGLNLAMDRLRGDLAVRIRGREASVQDA